MSMSDPQAMLNDPNSIAYAADMGMGAAGIPPLSLSSNPQSKMYDTGTTTSGSSTGFFQIGGSSLPISNLVGMAVLAGLAILFLNKSKKG